VRFHFGDLNPPLVPPDEEEGWTRISGPRSASAHLLAWLIGIGLFLAMMVALIFASFMATSASGAKGTAPPPPTPTPWFAMAATLLLSVPAHELLHALFQPDFGLSPSTILVMWPRRLRFGIFFEGSMARGHWLVMRMAPFVILCLLPTLLLILVMGKPLDFTVETCLTLLILVNSLGSGGDLLAAAWVASHIPRGSTLAFLAGRAYWRLGSEDAASPAN